jgi:hypothetical protein
MSAVAGRQIVLFSRKISFAFLAVVSLVTVAVPNARASAVYSYTGNPFTTFNGPAFSGSDSVTGGFTLASALGDNFNGDVLPSQFSFSDRLFSITNLDASFSVFDIQTSNTGAIVQWNISLSISRTPIFASISTSNSSDGAAIGGPTTFSSAGNSGNPGVWSPVATTPLPASLPLFAAGLGALGLLGWRRKRKGRADLTGTAGLPQPT